MSIKSRKELIKRTKERYLKSNKKEKSRILDELKKNTGLTKKHLINLLSAKHDLDFVPVINRMRKEKYDMQAICDLKQIWEIFDYPCGQRLEPMLPEYIEVLERCGELILSSVVKEKLLQIKSATIDRRLKPFKTQRRKKIFSTTRPGSLLKKQIPIKTSSWNEKRLGYGELDTVAHCGDNAGGDFVNSLTYTDISSCLTENIAVMGKAQGRILEALNLIENDLPFKLRGIDPDNGSEFINWQLYKNCLAKDIEFTRGRPYHKNDNAHVEQKNWTHVRKLVGYKRLDQYDQLEKLNELYRGPWRLYQNFFIPNKKLISKKRIGGKIKKKYDTPKTPYQRLLNHNDLSNEQKEKLKKIYATLNPAKLKREIDQKLKEI